MSYFCHSCGNRIEGEVERGRVARTSSCQKCTRDLHSCMNCKHYDRAAYNQCRENSAERVVDKERANFCDYFNFLDRDSFNAGEGKKDYLKGLDDLFKK